MAAEPFEKLEKLTASEIRWAGSKKELSAAFNEERDRLDGDFQASLLTFVGKHPTRHYWCGAFLTASDYLGGRQADRLLAVALWEQGLLLERAKAKDDRQLRPLHHLLAVEYARLGFRTLAGHHKACAEYFHTEFGEGGPGTSREDTKLYDAIETLPSTLAGQPSPATLPIGRYQIIKRGNENTGMLFDTATGKLWKEEGGEWIPSVPPPVN